MKDFSQQELESSRPNVSAKQAVNNCLKMLFSDKNKAVDDLVVSGLLYEELIGALLLCKDLIDENQT